MYFCVELQYFRLKRSVYVTIVMEYIQYLNFFEISGSLAKFFVFYSLSHFKYDKIQRTYYVSLDFIEMYVCFLQHMVLKKRKPRTLTRSFFYKLKLASYYVLSSTWCNRSDDDRCT